MKFYTDRFLLAPGPTEIPHRVRLAMARETTNPDLDPEFLRFYEGVRGPKLGNLTFMLWSARLYWGFRPL